MINKEKTTKTKTIDEIVSITCDKCGKTFWEDTNLFEFQEFHHIHFTGGYGSIFGDESEIECDICQNCLKKMIDGIYREDSYDIIPE